MLDAAVGYGSSTSGHGMQCNYINRCEARGLNVNLNLASPPTPHPPPPHTPPPPPPTPPPGATHAPPPPPPK